VCTLHKQLRLKRLLLQHLRVRHHRFKLQLPLVRVKLLKDKLQFKRLKVKQPQLSDLRVEQTMAQTHSPRTHWHRTPTSTTEGISMMIKILAAFRKITQWTQPLRRLGRERGKADSKSPLFIASIGLRTERQLLRKSKTRTYHKTTKHLYTSTKLALLRPVSRKKA
jgi:hypothetical protein